MKIAIATQDYLTVSGHAGQARHWLLWDLADHPSAQLLPAPQRVELTKEQVLHHVQDDAQHPLHGVELIIAASAGDGFIRYMQHRGSEVLLTGEDHPTLAVLRILAGEVQPDSRIDISTILCRLRDHFSATGS